MSSRVPPCSACIYAIRHRAEPAHQSGNHIDRAKCDGVAIPHGQFENKENIHSTGISVVQYPDGVVWDADEDETAYLVVGIAARADEHVGILSNLAEAIEEEESAEADEAESGEAEDSEDKADED